jgi:protein involved in polysaccharide export with SLBB domain
MMKQTVSLLALTLLVAIPKIQAQTDSGIQDQNGATDCSDPLMAGSSLCSQQNPAPLTQTPYGQQQAQPQNLTGTLPSGTAQSNSIYMDREELTSRNQNRYRSNPSVTLPPEPLTEFQKFVASTTGQVLPVFGSSLFRNVPTTFAPLDLTPVPLDYVIGPGDELRIRVWGQVNFNADLRVDRSGQVYLPQVGEVHVAGLPFSSLDEHLRAAVGRVYRNFDLTSDVGQIRAIQVYVAGQARRPGVYTVSSLSTLVDALFASGGPSVEGSMRHIQLKRNGAVVTDFDLYALLVRGDTSQDVKLLPGDVIYIPPVGREAAVTGSVRQPAIYELLDKETIDDALKAAGGTSTIAAESRISIERIQDHQNRQALEVAFDTTGLTSPVASGDILRVFSIVPAYDKTVTLRGNTANPGRFSWHSGMHLSDLIPDRDSLITRDYWWRRAQLGLPAPEFEPLDRFPNLRQPSYPIDLPRQPQYQPQYPYPSRQQQGQRPNSTYPDQNQTYSSSSASVAGSTEAPEDTQDLQQPAFLDGQQDNQAGSYPNNPAYPDGSQSEQTSSQDGSGYNPNLRTRQSQLATAQNPPAPPRRNDVRLFAPEIDWDYAVIERLNRDTLKTSLIPFDLGKLVLQHDPSQDLDLQPGDIVTVFSQGDIRVPLDQQTKFVRLEGEFLHSGVYSVKPGETLRDLVQRAGGLTPKAYLYGSEFTRDSTRMVQQRRIDEYVQNLQLQIQRGSLALLASPLSTAQDVASGVASQSTERDLIARLEQIRATGRIVLEFKPGSGGTENVPDIPLENGDRFTVPSVPTSVNVVGAVYDQNSFLFRDERRTGDYLRLAGGPDRDADAKHAFIIRADGSVVSRISANGLWGNTFNALPINPGDTVVVPEKTLKASALRGFLDWGQIFEQFALGAGAINVLK